MDEQKQTSPQPEAPKPTPAEAPKSPAEGVVKQNLADNGQTGPKGIAWDQVLTDYLTADSNGRYPSLQDLADKYGVSMSTIGERSTRENWVAKRNENIIKAEQIAAERKANEISDANSRHLTKWRRIQNMANRLLNTFETRLNKFDEAQKKLAELEAQGSNRGLSPEEVKELKKIRQPGVNQLTAITGVLRSAIEGERIVLGLPIIVSKADVTDNRPIALTPEVVAEIDRLFEVNKNDKPTDPNTNQ
jgi:hypothetical protein